VPRKGRKSGFTLVGLADTAERRAGRGYLFGRRKKGKGFPTCGIWHRESNKRSMRGVFADGQVRRKDGWLIPLPTRFWKEEGGFFCHQHPMMFRSFLWSEGLFDFLYYQGHFSFSFRGLTKFLGVVGLV
jgi:hypothetical protein